MRIETQNVRNTDPVTSRLAAEKFAPKRAKHQQIILSAIRDYPNSTAGELGEITGLGQVAVTRRLSEMNGLLIESPHIRTCGVNQTKMRAWVAK